MADFKLNMIQTPAAGASPSLHAPVGKSGGPDFATILQQSVKKSVSEVNTLQQRGDQALADMATGQVKDLHQAALAINKAESSMKLMLEVRNKAVSAYKEILRTQI